MRVDLAAEDEHPDVFRAEKDGFVLLADNPIELLGLAAIYEDVRPSEHRPYWWSIDDGPDEDKAPTRSQLIDEALARRDLREKELSTLRITDPTAWCAVLENALDNSGSVADAASHLGISANELRKILGDPLSTALKRAFN